jgi:hypothetical protein
MNIDPRILGLLAGTAITASACGGGVQTLEGRTATASTGASSSTNNASNANVATSEGTPSTGNGSGTTTVSVSPIPPEEYPAPCGRG